MFWPLNQNLEACCTVCCFPSTHHEFLIWLSHHDLINSPQRQMSCRQMNLAITLQRSGQCGLCLMCLGREISVAIPSLQQEQHPLNTPVPSVTVFPLTSVKTAEMSLFYWKAEEFTWWGLFSLLGLTSPPSKSPWIKFWDVTNTHFIKYKGNFGFPLSIIFYNSIKRAIKSPWKERINLTWSKFNMQSFIITAKFNIFLILPLLFFFSMSLEMWASFGREKQTPESVSITSVAAQS